MGMLEKKNDNKQRFLREGVLDDMILRLKEWDRESFKSVNYSHVTLASLIQVFQTNKFVLQQLERQIKVLRQRDNESCRHLIQIAYNIQIGLKNAFTGVEDERKNHFLME